jgi:hypothetical protein
MSLEGAYHGCNVEGEQKTREWDNNTLKKFTGRRKD